MNLKSCLLILLAFFFVAYSGSAQSIPKDLNQKIELNKDVKSGVLKNGMHYYLLHNSKPEKRVELRLAVSAGSLMEDNDQKGLAHFCEHMLFNGTKNFPKNDLIKFLESTGMRFGADVNAYTNWNETVYNLLLPTDNEEILNKGFQVLEDWAHNASFTDSDIDGERHVILEEWRLRNGANTRMIKQTFPYTFGTSKYAERFPIGDTAIILNAPYDALRRFYKKWYRPDLQAVIVVGDMPVTEMEQLVKKHFESIPKPKTPAPQENVTVAVGGGVQADVYRDKELPYVLSMLIYKHPYEMNTATYQEYKDHLIQNMVSQMLNQRFSELARKTPPPFIQAGGGYSSWLGTHSIDALQIQCALRPDSSGIYGGLSTIMTELVRAKKYGFTESELERTKKEMMSSIESMYNDRDKTESTNLSMELARVYLTNESAPGISYEKMMYEKFLPEITVADAKIAASKMMDDKSFFIGLAAPDKPNIQTPKSADLVAMYKKIEASNIQPYDDKTINEPLIANMPNPGSIVKEENLSKVGITKLTLSNGAIVYLKKTDFKNDQVVMRAFSWGGTSLASDADYISAEESANIVNESGLGKFSPTDLEKLLAGKIANVSPYVSTYDQGFYGSSTPGDLETMMQMLYLYITNPRKDQEAYESYLAKIQDILKNRSSDPQSIFRDSVNVILNDYNKRAYPLDEEKLAQLNLDKAMEFYKARFSNAGNFNYYFVGNFDVGKMKEFAKQYIASIPGMRNEEQWKDVGLRSPMKSMSKSFKHGIDPKSAVRLAINGDFEYNRKNRFDLQAMIEVLNILLRESIREDKGGVYGIGCRQSTDGFPVKDYSIGVSFTCDPKRVDELINGVTDVMKKVRNSKVDPTYIQKVTEIMKREYEVNMKENNYWVGAMYIYDYRGEDISNILDYLDYVKTVSADSVEKTAKQYLDTDRMIRLVLYPEN